MIWSKVEKLLGENIPECLKKMLSFSGYDTILSLKNISVQKVEKHVNEHGHDLIQMLNCCHHDFYKNQTIFKFLPGHCDFMFELSKCVQHYHDHYIDSSTEAHPEKHPDNTNEPLIFAELVKQKSNFSIIFKELIQTAIQNETCDKNNARYSDMVRFFATYVYIIGGRSCYEVLCQNIPLPSRATVCM